MRAMVSSALSTCSIVCVAINEKRIRVSEGATAGDTTGLTKIPSSRRSWVIANVLKSSRMNNGMIGVEVLPISNPRLRNPSSAWWVNFHRLSWRSGSAFIISMALSAAAVEAGVMLAVNMYEREWWRR